MSLNKLVGGDCGGNNSLVQLSNIVSRDASIAQSLSQSDRFVHEFMAQNAQAPQTFNMNALLNNVSEVEKANIQRHMQKPTTGQQMNVSSALPSQWMPGPSSSFMSPPQLLGNYHMPFQQIGPTHGTPVPIEYINESELTTASNSDVQTKAQEYVTSVQENDEVAYNQFMSFMKKISAGELNLEEAEQKSQYKDQVMNEMAEKYKDEWARLSDVDEHLHSDVTDIVAEEYDFTEGNMMLENKNALEIGKEKLKMGDIPGAVLCFEAAVQQQPNSAEAWYLLGTTQTENEQDVLALTALKKSLEIDPSQLDAYLTLAAAFTNESMPKLAYLALLDWIKANPKYNHFNIDINPQGLKLSELANSIMSLFIKAAQLNPTKIDPDVQNALGVMFNINQEFDKAVDCFKTALMVASDDPKLWNRLGATLANSDRSEEAVAAYQKALHLEPGFIRARYNVGITCMNLGAHKEAAEHFLSALNQQYKAKNMYPDSSSTDVSSSNIWTTLRMVCSFMGEHDVAKMVDDRDLSKLNAYFGLDSGI